MGGCSIRLIILVRSVQLDPPLVAVFLPSFLLPCSGGPRAADSRTPAGPSRPDYGSAPQAFGPSALLPSFRFLPSFLPSFRLPSSFLPSSFLLPSFLLPSFLLPSCLPSSRSSPAEQAAGVGSWPVHAGGPGRPGLPRRAPHRPRSGDGREKQCLAGQRSAAPPSSANQPLPAWPRGAQISRSTRCAPTCAPTSVRRRT